MNAPIKPRTDTRERILEPFFSTRKGGAGLGLPLARAIFVVPGYRDWFDPQPYRASLAIDGQISTSGIVRILSQLPFSSAIC